MARAGLLLVVPGVGLTAWAQSQVAGERRRALLAAVHAGVSDLVVGPAGTAGLALGCVGALMGLGWAVIVIAWLVLADVLEALDLPSAANEVRARHTCSLETALMTLVVLSGTLAVVGLGGAHVVGAVVLSGLAVAAVTALGDVVQDHHFQPRAGWTVATVTGLASLGVALSSLGLLEPPMVRPAVTRHGC